MIMESTSPHLRIRFVVEEFDEDGKSTDRHISFVDDVHHHQVRDFFDRCGLAADQLFGRGFGSGGARVISLAVTPSNKIQAIKVLRHVTGLGLKESKDLVEGTVIGVPPGQLVVCNNACDADRVVKLFKEATIDVIASMCTSVPPGLPGAVLA